MPVLSIAAVVLLVLGATVYVCLRVLKAYQERARQAGYASLGEYLRAAPRSDAEKRDAVDLALKGLVICLFGLLLPPLLLIGAFPLYYGTRKIAYASMGLGLLDDAESPRG